MDKSGSMVPQLSRLRLADPVELLPADQIGSVIAEPPTRIGTSELRALTDDVESNWIEVQDFERHDWIENGKDSARSEDTVDRMLRTGSRVEVKREFNENRNRVRQVLRNPGLLLAPVAFLFGFAGGVYIPVYTELMKDRVCEVVLGFPDSLCSSIGASSNESAAKAVQKTTTDYMLFNHLVTSVPSIIFALFFGSWSDRFGRKAVMLLTFVGAILSSGILIYCAENKLHPGFLLIVPVVAGFFGGWTNYLASSYSHIGDHTTDANRALAISLFSGCFNLGLCLGYFSGPALLKPFGYVVPFCVYAGVMCVAFLYVFIVVTDHHRFGNPTAEGSARHKVLELCQVKGLKENSTMLRRKRDNNKRLYMMILLTAYAAAVICSEAEVSILQLFLEFRPLKWSVQQFGTFAMVQGILSVVIHILMPPLKKLLFFYDSTIGIFASISGCAMVVLLACSSQSWMVYAAMGAGFLRPLMFVCLHSLLIGYVDFHEIGKIASVMGIIQSVGLIVSAAGLVKAFGASTEWWPGFVFVVEGFVLLIPLFAFSYVEFTSNRLRTPWWHKYFWTK